MQSERDKVVDLVRRLVSHPEFIALSDTDQIAKLDVIANSPLASSVNLSRSEIMVIFRERFNPLKVLLVCVSADDIFIRDTMIQVINHIKPGNARNIEFYMVNPEKYGVKRSSLYRDIREIWIDEEHYFEMPFGTEHPNEKALVDHGPYNMVIYSECSIYNPRRQPSDSPLKNPTKAVSQLRSILVPGGTIVIYPVSGLDKPFHAGIVEKWLTIFGPVVKSSRFVNVGVIRGETNREVFVIET